MASVRVYIRREHLVVAINGVYVGGLSEGMVMASVRVYMTRAFSCDYELSAH